MSEGSMKEVWRSVPVSCQFPACQLSGSSHGMSKSSKVRRKTLCVRSGAIIDYWDKKTNFKGQTYFDLHFYDDIYPLIDTISIKDNSNCFKPKKFI